MLSNLIMRSAIPDSVKGYRDNHKKGSCIEYEELLAIITRMLLHH